MNDERKELVKLFGNGLLKKTIPFYLNMIFIMVFNNLYFRNKKYAFIRMGSI